MGTENIKKIKTHNLEQYFNILRLHTTTQEKAIKNGTSTSICMHVGILKDHSTGSMVSIVDDKSITVWITGSSHHILNLQTSHFNPPRRLCSTNMFYKRTESLNTGSKRKTK